MEFFRVPCPGRGEVSIDGGVQGENKDGAALHVFQCGEGLHDISMACLVGKQCQEQVRRVHIAGTDPVLPPEVPFLCVP